MYSSGILCQLALFILHFAYVHTQSCNGLKTVQEILSSDPDMSLATAWSSNFGRTSPLFNNLDVNITSFVPTDEAIRQGLLQWDGISEAPSATGSGPYNSNVDSANVVAAYITAEGRYSPESLTEVPSINTILGMLEQKDYVISVFKNEAGKLIAQGLLPEDVAEVLEVKEACNGYVYKLNRLLLPGRKSTDISVDIDKPLVDQIFSNKNNVCSKELPEMLEGVPNITQWMQVLNSTKMLDPLSNATLSSTIFIPVDQANQPASTATADAVMYNMLKGAWCPEELVAAQSMNSMLGEYIEQDLPLKFTNDSDTLVISGEFGSVRVLNQTYGCNSVIFITEAPLYLARPGFAAPKTLPTLPIRHITCKPVIIPEDSTVTSSGSNTGLAVGLGLGLGCAALAAALGGAIWWKRKQRNAVLGSSTVEKSSSPVTEDSLEAGEATLTEAAAIDSSESDQQTATSAPATALLASLVSYPLTSISQSPTVVASNQQVGKESRSEKRTRGNAHKNQMQRLGSATKPVDLWEIDPIDVQIALDGNRQPIELGRGSYGAVYKGTLRGVQPAAVKVLNASVGSDAEAAFQKEAAILKHVNRDRNVVQLYGTSKMPDGKLLLVTELMDGGDLRKALNNPTTAEALAWHRGGKRVALDVARGLTALHAVNVIHRDLKSKNVLLTDTMTAKIADVGIAAVHSQGYLTASAGQVIGTLAWSAPELLLGERCTEKVDIYSLGILLWELATAKQPQRGFTKPPPPSERCPYDLAELIKECTDANPKYRPTAKEVYERILDIPPVTEI